MKYAVNESAPLPLSLSPKQYLYGTNEYIPVVDLSDNPMPISEVMAYFSNPKMKVSLSSGKKVNVIPAHKIIVPVNRENVIRSGILDASYAELIPDSIVLSIPKNKDFLTKPELFLLDFLNGYDWSRPLVMLNMGGDLNIGIKDYLEWQGHSYKFIPVKNKPAVLKPGFVQIERLYSLMSEVYSYDALARDDYFIDYQNYYTHLGVNSVRQVFVTAAIAFEKAGQPERALEMLNTMWEKTAPYPLDAIPIGFSANDYMVIESISLYYRLGQAEKANAIAEALYEELLSAACFYAGYYEYAKNDYETCVQYLYFLADELEKGGNTELSKKITENDIPQLFNAV